MEGEKRIPDWYEGRSILVTGGTGFMGKVLIEKLLRSCPKIQTIYLLIRPKRGQQVADRLRSLLNLSIFDEVRKMPGQLDKIHAVESDVTLPALGLTMEDQALLRENVSVIFHSAATVKFDEALKESVSINMLATKTLLQLAQTMVKLEAMVHVSTAYCNCQEEGPIQEHFYPAERDPEKIMEIVQTLDEDLLEVITPKLLGKRPNTYTFTKALAEVIVSEQSGALPIAIVRPSIVTAAWKEPLPGWIDNMNGPTGLLVSAGKGVLRTLLCDKNAIGDLMPVDIAINLCISVAWHTAVSRPNNIVIYNCTSGAKNPMRWRDFQVWGQEYLLRYPTSGLLWYPGGSFKKYRLTNFVARVLFQVVPSFIIDLLMRIMGKKPIMMNVQDRLLKASNTLQFFTTREFLFANDNMISLWKTLSPEDKETFYFDISKFDWKAYFETYVIGTRCFILKESLDTLPAARKNLIRMYILHRLAQVSFYGSILWFLINRSFLTKKTFFALISILLKTINKVRTLSTT